MTFSLTLIIVLGLSTEASAQHTDLVRKISAAISQGKAAELSIYFSNTLDLVIPSNEGTYSKKQAQQILKVFFSKHASQSFIVEHQGNSNDGSTYLIGLHKTTEGKSFRVYVLITKQSGESLIQQLRFEEE